MSLPQNNSASGVVRRVRVIDNEKPRSVLLFTNHLSAQPPSREFGSHSRWRPDHPAAVQHRQTFLRYDESTRFKGHQTTPRKKVLERLPYALSAYLILAGNYENRVGLIQTDQTDQSFNIAEVEGVLEEPMYFRGTVCRH